jgi:prevent-host-death family protein
MLVNMEYFVMTTVSIHAAKAHFSALVGAVQEKKERIIICRYGKAVAELIPFRHGKRTVLDKSLAQTKILEDPTITTTEEWEDA